MKKNFAITFVLFALASMFLGCGSSSPISTNEVTVAENPKPVPSGTPVVASTLDKAVVDEVAVIPECDEVLKLIAAETSRKEENEAAGTSKTAFLNKIKESIKKSAGDNKENKAEIAKNCKAFKAQIERYKKMDENRGK